MSAYPVLSTPPAWVEAPAGEAGSIDPLGYQIEVDAIADKILPGLTVTTTRARYLSFLCWALDDLDGDAAKTDRWEVALSAGEFLYHEGETKDCKYLGVRELQRREFLPKDPLPRRLHQRTARSYYSALAKSTGLIQDDGELSALGSRLARQLGAGLPSRLPKRGDVCRERMPCLSEPSVRERRWLQQALLEDSGDAQRRWQTLREMTVGLWRRTQGEPQGILRHYLAKRFARAEGAPGHLHRAAVLELSALPLTRLFLHLYKNRGEYQARWPREGRFRAYDLREDPRDLYADVIGHLERAAALGEEDLPPLSADGIRQWLLARHQEKKPDAPWVAAAGERSWRVLRPGLEPKRLPGLHAFRVRAFYSLLRDVGRI